MIVVPQYEAYQMTFQSIYICCSQYFVLKSLAKIRSCRDLITNFESSLITTQQTHKSLQIKIYKQEFTNNKSKNMASITQSIKKDAQSYA